MIMGAEAIIARILTTISLHVNLYERMNANYIIKSPPKSCAK